MLCDKTDAGREKPENHDYIQYYSLPVRIGNWNNQLAIEEAKLEFNAYKRDHCKLLIAKTKTMLKNVLQPVTTSMALEDIRYGGLYQIMASGINSPNPRETSRGLVLSGLIDERDLEFSNNFRDGCSVSASPNKTPCRRNTFILVSSVNKQGPVNYGDNFFIQLNTPPGIAPLYLQAENTTTDTFGHHLKLKLSSRPNFYCHFKMLHWQPKLRKDTIGGMVLPKSTVIIQHISSGRNLAVEEKELIPTFFGNECEVTCHSFRNANNFEPRMMWNIVGRHEPDLGMLIKAAQGEDVPPELLG